MYETAPKYKIRDVKTRFKMYPKAKYGYFSSFFLKVKVTQTFTYMLDKITQFSFNVGSY